MHNSVRTLLGCVVVAALVAGCGRASDEKAAAAPTPRFADGLVRFDRLPGEKGYWDNPSVVSLVEEGVQVEFGPGG